MNPFTFQVPSNILFESGASKKVVDLAAEFGAQRILLVTDRGVRDAGLTRAAKDALKAAGRDLVLFEDVVADPPSNVDRKSTRLNSSHANISYAVFCLKKKKNSQ